VKLLFALGILVVLGCGPSPKPWGTRGDRLLGIGSSRAEDPVSGTIVEKTSSVKVEYQGATYYFETQDTAAEFLAHPSEYAVPDTEGGEGRIDVR
jgi:YHS domain-containing protein